METGEDASNHAVDELESALTLWVEGEMNRATPRLLAVENVARSFKRERYGMLYRGMLVETLPMRRDGSFIIDASYRQLQSWAVNSEAVLNFMHGWDRPWILIEKTGLDVFCDLPAFDETIHPRTNMTKHSEVIAKIHHEFIIERHEYRRFEQ